MLEGNSMHHPIRLICMLFIVVCGIRQCTELPVMTVYLFWILWRKKNNDFLQILKNLTQKSFFVNYYFIFSFFLIWIWYFSVICFTITNNHVIYNFGKKMLRNIEINIYGCNTVITILFWFSPCYFSTEQ